MTMDLPTRDNLMDIQVANPGLNRAHLAPRSPIVSAFDTYHLGRGTEYQLSNIQSALSDPWSELEWWESELLAESGIRQMCSAAFIEINDSINGNLLVPTRMLYPSALRSSETARVKQAGKYVVAAVRQARECYTAATSLGVTALSRPLLYFYGALALARAATVVLLGVEGLGASHGLTVVNGPNAASDKQNERDKPWSALIRWQNAGNFASLYRVCRWDEVYKDDKVKRHTSFWTTSYTFHILECLRYLGYGGGSLPPALDTPTVLAPHGKINGNVFLLMPYSEGSDLYLQTAEQLRERRFAEVPRIPVQYMVLYYFSELARYHPVVWQEILEGATYPESYAFRSAAESVAHEYVREITSLLSLPNGNVSYYPQNWCETLPDINYWWRQPQISITHKPPLMPMYHRTEWDGDPKSVRAHDDKATPEHSEGNEVHE